MDQQYGWMEASFQAPCDLSATRPDKEWITSLLRQNPDLTGWPFFVDLWTPKKPEWRPRIRDGVWEARIDTPTDNNRGIDYWRIDGRRGLFFAARALEDDTSPQNPNPGQTLEFGLAILRVAELLVIATRFANHLCEGQCDDDPRIPLTIKWTKLQNRILSNWANRGRYLSGDYRCHTDTVSKIIEMPLGSAQDQIVFCTQEIVEDLFLHFDGWVCPASVVEDLVNRLFNRQLF